MFKSSMNVNTALWIVYIVRPRTIMLIWPELGNIEHLKCLIVAKYL